MQNQAKPEQMILGFFLFLTEHFLKVIIIIEEKCFYNKKNVKCLMFNVAVFISWYIFLTVNCI